MPVACEWILFLPESEFDLIGRYFARPSQRSDVLLGIGDDAALLRVPPEYRLAMAVDTLVEGVHFPVSAPARDLGWKALAVNLSDLAAMGAEPAWFTLSLTLPEADNDWLAAFSAGLFELAGRFNIELVGGDTTRGPLTISVQASGFVRQALTRNAARTGQLIMVSGTLGDAALALQEPGKNGRHDACLLQRLNRPEPRVALGRALPGLATAGIDISDGLLADLGHVLEASGCGATLEIERIPRSAAFDAASVEDPWPLLLAGGDDYELCFTLDENKLNEVARVARQAGVAVTQIGRIESEPGLRCVRADGSSYQPAVSGYDHFG